MKWFEFVFSKEPGAHLKRHALFWIAWWIYFAGSYFFTQQETGVLNTTQWLTLIFIKSFLLLLCHAILVYSCIYIVDYYGIKKFRWLQTVTILTGAVFLTTACSYSCYSVFFPNLEYFFGLPGVVDSKLIFWNSFSAGFISSLKAAIAAVAIKMIKFWWQKQKETEELDREKIAMELLLLKAQIQPKVLFSSLEKISSLSQHDPVKASELLIQLSDVLSYMLYECDQDFVPLEKELRMINNYISLEKTISEKLEISFTTKGDVTEKSIAPLLILPFLETSLYYCKNQQLENSWLNMDIRITNEDFNLKLVNGKSPSQEFSALEFGNAMSNVSKRLDLLYPSGNELEFHEEPDIMMTHLKIELGQKSNSFDPILNPLHDEF